MAGMGRRAIVVDGDDEERPIVSYRGLEVVKEVGKAVQHLGDPAFFADAPGINLVKRQTGDAFGTPFKEQIIMVVFREQIQRVHVADQKGFGLKRRHCADESTEP